MALSLGNDPPGSAFVPSCVSASTPAPGLLRSNAMTVSKYLLPSFPSFLTTPIPLLTILLRLEIYFGLPCLGTSWIMLRGGSWRWIADSLFPTRATTLRGWCRSRGGWTWNTQSRCSSSVCNLYYLERGLLSSACCAVLCCATKSEVFGFAICFSMAAHRPLPCLGPHVGKAEVSQGGSRPNATGR